MEIGLSHYVEDRHYDKLSPVHYPLFYLKKYSNMRNRVQPDAVMRSLINNAWGERIDFAVSLPNLNALYMDFSKWSNTEVPRDWTSDRSILGSIQKLKDIISVGIPEVVTGPEYHEAYRALDPLSSPGFPWNKLHKTRRDWVNHVDHEAAVLWWIRHGECIWNVSPKEEIRSLKKLESDQVRAFMAGLVEENIVAIVALGDVSDQLCKNWRKLPFTVGMSTKHGGWNYRIKRWPHWATECRDKDGFKFEGSIESWMYDVLYEVVSPFIDDTKQVYICGEAVGTRRFLFRLLCDRWKESPCVFGDGVGCWKWGCNPSGASWTIWVNTIIMAFFRYWHLLDKGLTIDEIDENFAFDFHGDDSVDGATPDYAKWTEVGEFNSWAKSRGLSVYLKTEHFGRVHEVEYLSSFSVLREGIYLPVHKTPEKLLASAALKAKFELPKCSHANCPGWSVKSYHLARLAGICTELWPDPTVYAKVSRVYREYKDLYDRELCNDLHWNEAQKQFLGNEYLRRLWMTQEAVAPLIPESAFVYESVYQWPMWSAVRV